MPLKVRTVVTDKSELTVKIVRSAKAPAVLHSARDFPTYWDFWRHVTADVTASLPLLLLEELGLPCATNGAWTLRTCYDYVLDLTASFDEKSLNLKGAAEAVLCLNRAQDTRAERPCLHPRCPSLALEAALTVARCFNAQKWRSWIID